VTTDRALYPTERLTRVQEAVAVAGIAGNWADQIGDIAADIGVIGAFDEAPDGPII